ncbi:LuxR family transcriptional regulator, maltose regulon positive regulatory protein [Paraburkholderia phenazinium]|uniref:LuxR family transcriptional regulator, maltose regulon positive regulatory protein n=2 Tax=Paraburkholderia phenazinium TaxID=60549 RepID=A0A1G7VE96_9BURK|nr:LuxR family transcriptional regulator, maltose regulon positive regulatory protein [Paraburkholderia phenazinium]
MMAPRLPPGCVQRPALLERLCARPAHGLTVVTAPAGFGKTTLLAEWSEALSEQKHPVAWLSLDGEDDDPQQFGAYLVAAFSRTSGDIARQAQQLLGHDELTPIKTIISVLLNGIAASGLCVFLVLDDVDRLTAKPVLAVVSRLLRYAPENLHVLLGARGEPALTLGQLRTPEKIMRLGVDDLRFSIDEAQAYFDQTGAVPLDRTSVALLNEATEGWVAGLQLACLALSQAGDTAKVATNLAGNSSVIDRYLNDTVLAHLPPPMLKFLMHTSILERLTPAVCDAIMGSGGGSGAKLDWLERHNVFIRPLDDRHEWYRYHALFSDALRRRLVRQMPRELPVLHHRASQWFAGAHLWREAVRHALAAGELEQAAQWIENCAIEMLERGEPHTLPGEGPPARALLQRFRQIAEDVSTVETAYVDRLLAAFDDACGSPAASPTTVESAPVSADILSAREFEVLNHVACGLSNKEIGRSLKLAPETVKWHLKNIFEKLNVSSRIEAVQKVLGLGVGEDRAAM